MLFESYLNNGKGELTFIHDDLVGSSLELSVTVSSWCGDRAPHTLMMGICNVVAMLSRRPAGHDSDVGVLLLMPKSVRLTYESMNAARLPGWTLCSKYSRYTLARSWFLSSVPYLKTNEQNVL